MLTEIFSYLPLLPVPHNVFCLLAARLILAPTARYFEEQKHDVHHVKYHTTRYSDSVFIV